MKVTESKNLKKGTRVYWRGDAEDSGIITETSWNAVTIAWDNGKVASVHHGDMGEIQHVPTTAAAISAKTPSSTESSWATLSSTLPPQRRTPLTMLQSTLRPTPPPPPAP